MKVVIIFAFVMVGLVALTLADDQTRPNTRDVQTPAQDRKLLLKVGKKLMKMMKKMPRPQPAPYVPYSAPPSYAPAPSYSAPPPSYGGGNRR